MTPGRRAAVTALVSAYLGAQVVVVLPGGGGLLAAPRALLGPPLRMVGLGQRWDMFAPDPPRIDERLEAVLRWRDGSTGRWAYPRMAAVPFPASSLHERHRKWAENLGDDGSWAARADAARHAARVNARPGNPVVHVALERRRRPLPPPDGRPAGPEVVEVVYATGRLAAPP